MTGIGLSFLAMMCLGNGTIFPRSERITLRLVAGALQAVGGVIAVVLGGLAMTPQAPDWSGLSAKAAHSVPEGPP